MQLKISWVILIFLGLAGTAFAGTFRASAVQVDITPTSPQWLAGYAARQSDGVHDHLFHRIAALDDGKTTVYLVSTDTCMMSPAYVDKVKQDIQQKLGIPPQSIWWAVTHTHSAPEIGPPGAPAMYMPERYKQASTGESNAEYTQFAEDKLIEGLREARQKLQPAQLGLGTGFATANIDRRAMDDSGKVTLGLNPDGPTDRQIGLIRLETTSGKLIALLANYAIHGTDLGQENLKISGDVPGVVADFVEQKLGAPVLFLNGAEGNLAPIYSVYPDPVAGHLDQFKVLLGNRILQANAHIAAMTSDVILTASEATVESPLRAGLTWPAAMGKYIRDGPGREKLVQVPVPFLEINHDAVLWGAPVELFCQIAMDVRNQSRFPYTFYVGILNGWLGYLPTGEAVRQGGYEPATSPFTDRGEDDFRNGVVTHLAGMPR
ncbi:MAG TPA: neutral/alkaline non-lysosomal ceramidase N-terminal domain-containing protein [Acidobacteriaceae bacterium]|nr:neutral/alkaline non-lysosomal ceramidase N-terminal domain-containing protein [Acidobacteriaceae bacterium]